LVEEKGHGKKLFSLVGRQLGKLQSPLATSVCVDEENDKVQKGAKKRKYDAMQELKMFSGNCLVKTKKNKKMSGYEMDGMTYFAKLIGVLKEDAGNREPWLRLLKELYFMMNSNKMGNASNECNSDGKNKMSDPTTCQAAIWDLELLVKV